MPRSLTVHRKGYRRKAFTSRRGGKRIRVGQTGVRPSTFRIRDRGKPGKGLKIVPPLEKGALGGVGFFKRPAKDQERIVFNRAKKVGEGKVVGELAPLQVFFKRTSPAKSKRALELSKRVAGSFKDKLSVGYPKGFA